MKKWRIDYAYRKNGEYKEGELFVIGMYIDAAISEANSVLNGMAWKDDWDVKDNGHYHDRFMIWNIGIMMDADDEVI